MACILRVGGEGEGGENKRFLKVMISFFEKEETKMLQRESEAKISVELNVDKHC